MSERGTQTYREVLASNSNMMSFIGNIKATSDFLKFVRPSDRVGRKSQGPAILPSMSVRVSDKILFVYFALHRKSEMQLVTRNDHGQLGIRFCFE